MNAELEIAKVFGWVGWGLILVLAACGLAVAACVPDPGFCRLPVPRTGVQAMAPAFAADALSKGHDWRISEPFCPSPVDLRRVKSPVRDGVGHGPSAIAAPDPARPC